MSACFDVFCAVLRLRSSRIWRSSHIYAAAYAQIGDRFEQGFVYYLNYRKRLGEEEVGVPTALAVVQFLIEFSFDEIPFFPAGRICLFKRFYFY